MTFWQVLVVAKARRWDSARRGALFMTARRWEGMSVADLRKTAEVEKLWREYVRGGGRWSRSSSGSDCAAAIQLPWIWRKANTNPRSN